MFYGIKECQNKPRKKPGAEDDVSRIEHAELAFEGGARPKTTMSSQRQEMALEVAAQKGASIPQLWRERAQLPLCTEAEVRERRDLRLADRPDPGSSYPPPKRLKREKPEELALEADSSVMCKLEFPVARWRTR
jgi:hypothetical protein